MRMGSKRRPTAPVAPARKIRMMPPLTGLFDVELSSAASDETQFAVVTAVMGRRCG
jgi:hypothetical protein